VAALPRRAVVQRRELEQDHPVGVRKLNLSAWSIAWRTCHSNTPILPINGPQHLRSTATREGNEQTSIAYIIVKIQIEHTIKKQQTCPNVSHPCRVTGFLLLATAFVVLGLAAYAFAEEPRKANESAYNTDSRKANTSEGLTKADLAWHATHTYGWDCSEVVSKGAPTLDGYFIITCANGTKLRVYPRKQRQPRITNIKGGYD